jgi:hypothetical protein
MQTANRSRHDVVVVGGRVAGSATAMLLARLGHEVVVLDQASFPSDTVSTHSIARSGVVQLRRWGLLDEVLDSGQVDTHGYPLVNRLQRTLAPVTAHPVSRTLGEGEVVAGFEVVEVPGHSPGALAFWRARDRVLVCGDVLANFGLHPSRPRLVLAPAALS